MLRDWKKRKKQESGSVDKEARADKTPEKMELEISPLHVEDMSNDSENFENKNGMELAKSTCGLSTFAFLGAFFGKREVDIGISGYRHGMPLPF